MRIVDIHECAVPISRYADVSIGAATLTTSVVAVTTDVVVDGVLVVGYGFSSFGRFAQSGLIRERFAPRLLRASPSSLMNSVGDNFDPFRAWEVMMHGEKPGGHGERCVAVGTLDMAIWDAAAKTASAPLCEFLAELVGTVPIAEEVPAYAAGGYAYPSDDIRHLSDEVRRFLDFGYTRVKIKIGATDLSRDLQRVEAVLKLLQAPNCLAVDAMHAYNRASATEAAASKGTACGGSKIFSIRSISKDSRIWRWHIGETSRRASPFFPNRKRDYWIFTGVSTVSVTSCFSIPYIATEFQDICESSHACWRKDGHAPRFGRTEVICFLSM